MIDRSASPADTAPPPPRIERRPRGARTLVLLALVFFLPLAIAFAIYYGGGWRPAGSSAQGELIDPARPLPELSGTEALRGKWTLVYVGDGACDDACRRTLYVMRQARLALNNEMTRVGRVMLVTGHCCDEHLAREHPGLVTLDATRGGPKELLPLFEAPAPAHAIYLVDPLGNLMMRFDARGNPKGLLTDLKRLLKLSHIG